MGNNRDLISLIKNVYDDSTIDTLRQLDQNLRTLMTQNPELAHIEINQYERMPIAKGGSKSQIRVDVSKKGVKGCFFISEDVVTRLEESDNIKRELHEIMNQIRGALHISKN
jgi:hypothetical protein